MVSVASIPEAGCVARDSVCGICLPLLPRAALLARKPVVERNRVLADRPTARNAAGFAALKASRENIVFQSLRVERLKLKILFNGLSKRREPATSGLILC